LALFAVAVVTRALFVVYPTCQDEKEQLKARKEEESEKETEKKKKER
jgi:hypothetical protein